MSKIVAVLKKYIQFLLDRLGKISFFKTRNHNFYV